MWRSRWAGRDATVTHYGDRNWRILEANGSSDYLSTTLSGPERYGSRISYKLNVSVGEDAPAGCIHEGILLMTTDRADKPIQVMVQGRIVRAIRVGPRALHFGSVAPREEATTRLVVSGKRPFRIASVEVDSDCFEFEIPKDGEPKKLHIVPVRFTASDHPGAFVNRIYINTDQGEESASVEAYVNVKALTD